MANKVQVNDKGAQVITLDTTGAVVIHNSFGSSKIGSWKLQVVVGGGSPGSFVIKQRLHGSGLTGSNWISTLYYNEATTTVPSAGDPVTANGLYVVVCDQCDVQLDYTSGANGMTVYARPYNG